MAVDSGVEAAFDLLVRLAHEGYRPATIPGPDDAALSEALRSVASAEAFAELTPGVDLQVARVLTHFAFRAATLALREREPAHIVPGLIALQLALAAEDPRDVTLHYPAHYHAAETIGLDAGAVSREATVLERSEFHETPAEFADRTPRSRSLAAMHIRTDGHSYMSATQLTGTSADVRQAGAGTGSTEAGEW